MAFTYFTDLNSSPGPIKYSAPIQPNTGPDLSSMTPAPTQSSSGSPSLLGIPLGGAAQFVSNLYNPVANIIGGLGQEALNTAGAFDNAAGLTAGRLLGVSDQNNPFLNSQNYFGYKPTTNGLDAAGNLAKQTAEGVATLYGAPEALLGTALYKGAAKQIAERGIGSLAPEGGLGAVGNAIKTPFVSAVKSPGVAGKVFNTINAPQAAFEGALKTVPVLNAAGKVLAPLASAGMRTVIGGAAADIANGVTGVDRKYLPFGTSTQDTTNASNNIPLAVQAPGFFLGNGALANTIRTADQVVPAGISTLKDLNVSDPVEYLLGRIMSAGRGADAENIVKGIADYKAQNPTEWKYIANWALDNARAISSDAAGKPLMDTPVNKIDIGALTSALAKTTVGAKDAGSVKNALVDLQDAIQQSSNFGKTAGKSVFDYGLTGSKQTAYRLDSAKSIEQGGAGGTLLRNQLKDQEKALRSVVEQNSGMSKKAVSHLVNRGEDAVDAHYFPKNAPGKAFSATTGGEKDVAAAMKDLARNVQLQKDIKAFENKTGYTPGNAGKDFVNPGSFAGKPGSEIATNQSLGQKITGALNKGFGGVLNPRLVSNTETQAYREAAFRNMVHDYVAKAGENGRISIGNKSYNAQEFEDLLKSGTKQTGFRGIMQYAKDNAFLGMKGTVGSYRDVPAKVWSKYFGGNEELGNVMADLSRKSAVTPWDISGLAGWVDRFQALGVAPNALIKMMNIVRYNISPEYELRLHLKNRLLMGENGYDPTTKIDPQHAASLVAAIENRSGSLLGQIRAQAIEGGTVDEGLARGDRSAFGKLGYDSTQDEGRVIQQYIKKQTGADIKSIEDLKNVPADVQANAAREIHRVFHYGEGRTPLEKSLNAVFFPLSFEKKVGREALAFFAEHPVAAQFVNGLVQQEEQWANSPQGQDFRSTPGLARDLAFEAGKLLPYHPAAISPTYESSAITPGMPGGQYVGRFIAPFANSGSNANANANKTPPAEQIATQFDPLVGQLDRGTRFIGSVTGPNAGRYISGTPSKTLFDQRSKENFFKNFKQPSP